MDNKKLVILLKSAAQQTDQPDPYVQLLIEDGFETCCIPTLNFCYVNTDDLRHAVRHAHEYSCLILTSPRACEAISHAFTTQEWNGEIGCLWRRKRTYVVGAATDKAARDLNLTTIGSESGSSEHLAAIIINDARSCVAMSSSNIDNMEVGSAGQPLELTDETNENRKLEQEERQEDKEEQKQKQIALFLCGNMKLDILPQKLAENGVLHRCLTVYETITDPDIETNLKKYTLINGCYPTFIVFYSPSGVVAAYPLLKRLDWPLDHIHLVGIGATTAKSLSSHGARVSAVAQHPSPEHLLQALRTLSHIDTVT